MIRYVTPLHFHGNAKLPPTTTADLARTLTAAGMLLLSALASAQTIESPSQSKPAAGGVVGIGIASLPEYRGADHNRIRAVPLLEYHWANGMFVGGDNDAVIGYQISSAPGLQYGVALSADEGRKERRSKVLSGMGDIATRAIFLGFAKGAITDHLSVSSSVHVGAGDDSKGALLKLGAAYAIPLSPSAQLNFNLGATLANASYMQSFYGVSATQAAMSGYRVYTPSGGVHDATVGMRLSYQIDRDWSLLAGWSNTTLSSNAKDSPLVRKSSGQKLVIGAAYSLK